MILQYKEVLQYQQNMQLWRFFLFTSDSDLQNDCVFLYTFFVKN